MHGIAAKSRRWSLDETVSRLESEVSRTGLRLFAVIDLSAPAAYTPP